MPTPFVAGNWKMNPTSMADAEALASELVEAVGGVDGVTRVACPPFVALSAVAGALAGSGIGVGAQNAHPEAKGAFTGEVPLGMLAGLCAYVIVGHSERRQLFSETDAFINAKVNAVLTAGLMPILCVGETMDERDSGRAKAVVRRQVSAGLAGVEPEQANSIVVAYEPVWAIGTGRAATPEMAQEMCAVVRSEVGVALDADGGIVPVLYGGSVNPGNADSLAAQPDIDGALVGGASLVAADFAAIVRAFAPA
ncbi:MAG: triose-phosphate isomerase [Chloroflexi bacterium]|nr:triose-phosphate isomerase [Chloroflexota bacterium]